MGRQRLNGLNLHTVLEKIQRRRKMEKTTKSTDLSVHLLPTHTPTLGPPPWGTGCGPVRTPPAGRWTRPIKSTLTFTHRRQHSAWQMRFQRSKARTHLDNIAVEAFQPVNDMAAAVWTLDKQQQRLHPSQQQPQPQRSKTFNRQQTIQWSLERLSQWWKSEWHDDEIRWGQTCKLHPQQSAAHTGRMRCCPYWRLKKNRRRFYNHKTGTKITFQYVVTWK